MKTRDTVTLLAMLEITGAYTGKALVKRNNMNESISIIRQRLINVLDIFNFFCNVRILSIITDYQTLLFGRQQAREEHH